MFWQPIAASAVVSAVRQMAAEWEKERTQYLNKLASAELLAETQAEHQEAQEAALASQNKVYILLPVLFALGLGLVHVLATNRRVCCLLCCPSDGG